MVTEPLEEGAAGLMRISTATWIATVALGLVTGLGGCGDEGGMDHGSMSGDHGDAGHDEQGLEGANQADVMFAMMMVPHHEQAIEMSDIVLSSPGVSDEVTGLANRVKAAQQPEIDRMQGWLEDWGRAGLGRGMEGMAGYGMAGMLDEEEMQALADASGGALEELYLRGMVEHHEAAIDMAREELDAGEFEPARALAQDIVDTQQAEIDEMEELLK
jgi:uncharacterized protein (DUF305 family)